MRYMLTLAVIHDDEHDAADIEAATDGAMWGEVYLTDGTPVEFVTVSTAVIDKPALAEFLHALEVGRDGIEDDELAEVVGSVAHDFVHAADNL